jgi:hypothetical protein
MASLSYTSVNNIGYNPPVGINIDDHEYSKFDKHEVELDNNELEPASDSECGDDDDMTDTQSDYQATTDTDNETTSEVSEVDYKSVFFNKRAPKVERVYTVILQEEEFLPE